MATQTYKQLSVGQASSSISQFYITPISVITTYIKDIFLYNSNSSQETVEIYVSGSSTQNRIFKRTLNADETVEFAPQFPIISPTSQSMYIKSTNSSQVNYFMYGMEES